MKQWRNCLIALSVVCAVLFAGLLLQPAGTVLSSRGGDLWHIGYPMRLAASGTPLWFSAQFCGMPLDAKIQLGPFYPLNLVFDFLPLWRAFNFAFIFHVLLAGAGVALFLTELEVCAAAAFLGAVSFMLGGAILWRVNLGHLDIVSSLAWTGFVFWAAHRLVRKPSLKTAAALALCGGLQVLCGHPQFFYITLLGVLAYCIRLLLQEGDKKRAFKFILLGFAGMAVVSAAGWLPLLAFAKYSSRAQAGAAFAGSYSFPPEQFLTLVMPGFFGTSIYWGKWYPWELGAYTGICSLFFLPVLWRKGEGGSAARFFLLLTACSFIAALGKYTPLFAVFYKLLPGFALFRCPSRFAALGAFALCVAGALGFDRVLKAGDGDRFRLLKSSFFAALAAVLLGAAGVIILRADNYGVLRKLMESELSSPDRMANFGVFTAGPATVYSAIFSGWLKMAGMFCALALLSFFTARRRAIFALAICCLAVVDLFSAGYGRITSFDSNALFAAKPAADFVRAQSHPGRVAGIGVGAGMLNAVGLETADGYDAFRFLSYQELMNYAQGVEQGGEVAKIEKLPPLLAYLNLQYLVSRDELPSNPLLQKVFEGDYKVYRWSPGLERFYFSPSFAVVPREQMLAKLAAWEPGQPPLVLLEENPGISSHSGASAKAVIKVFTLSPSKIELEVETNASGMIAVSQSWYPGWRAFVNDKPAKVLRTNYFMQSVAVAQGTSTVLLEYSPRLLYGALVVSLLGAVALAIALLF